VDAAAPQKLSTAKKELHKLLDDGSIGSTPMLILANKIDINPHVGEAELIDKLQLNYVMETPWMGKWKAEAIIVLPLSVGKELFLTFCHFFRCFSASHKCSAMYKHRSSCGMVDCTRKIVDSRFICGVLVTGHFLLRSATFRYLTIII
jgi:hypothetical protein